MIRKNTYTDEKWEDLHIVKRIGSGLMGSAYLAKFKGDDEKYVLKISKVLKSCIEKYGRSWGEIMFYDTFAKKHKKILKLYSYDYKIDPNCDPKEHKHPLTKKELDKKHFNKEFKKFQEKLINSPYCLYQVVPYISGLPLGKYYDDLYSSAGISLKAKAKPKGKLAYNNKIFTRKEYYSWFVDILLQVQLLMKNGFQHSDIHPGNIMIMDNNEAVLIDYGRVNHKKWLPTEPKYRKERLLELDARVDIFSLFLLTYAHNFFVEFKRLNSIYGNKKLPMGPGEYQKICRVFVKTPSGQSLWRLCEHIPEGNKLFSVRLEMVFELGRMLYTHEVINLEFGSYADRINISTLWLIDIEDVFFLIKNYMDTDKIVSHFKRRLKEL